jgi:hypothetical protein
MDWRPVVAVPRRELEKPDKAINARAVLKFSTPPAKIR